MKDTVSVLAAMTALDNEPRLLVSLRRLLTALALQDLTATPTYHEALATYTHVINSRFATGLPSVLDETTPSDDGNVAVCVTIDDVSCIEVGPVAFLSRSKGEAIAQQTLTLVRVVGEPIKINTHRVIADTIALGDSIMP
ncbi:hypothetical protein [Chitinimonas sp. BJB300]|uniref:hypothetical protein n=1 Tax=Chitinimonas sp. BJB300 TaxID=1559339 RepID=UPI000C0FCF69|nr:hypothetical protein [Chitinimonas sp. BJB300]PHV11936.1 hypothetical protein CSQ89_08415 [Chitinimonas sp. BJB300]TSJ84470.1 hypothetical protein FG002_020195 [Chitinimonas sp. BJB300]